MAIGSLWIADGSVARGHFYSWYPRESVELPHTLIYQTVFCMPLQKSTKSVCTLSKVLM